ncbi:MAG TPA: hypothetical protein VGM88_12550 [Kofleriaceae bacterium]|jgi:hypothetical protein
MRRLVWLWLLAACGLHSSVPAPPTPAYVRVTFVDALIRDHRDDGKPWRVTQPSRALRVLGAVAGVAAGQAKLGAEVGSILAGDPRALPPAPVVTLAVGGRLYASLAVTPTLRPRWDDAIVIDARGVRPDDPVVLTVLDGIDDNVIGTVTMPFAELVARDARTVATIPNVEALDLRVEPTMPQHSLRTVVVPATDAAAIPVEGGDVLDIRATGIACVAPDKCLPPGGDETRVDEVFGPTHYRAADWNYPAFADRPHASLVGWFGDTPVWIGEGGRFRAPRTGVLTLTVNDRDKGNNSSGFTVEIEANR